MKKYITMNEKQHPIKNKIDNKDLFVLANKLVCNFITQKYIYKFSTDEENNKVSLRKYQAKCGISHTTLQKLVCEDGYNIPLAVLYVILHYENISLSNFFTELEIYSNTEFPLNKILGA
ncbi:hypothetical protein [Flavobacterium sp. HSC-61S13]|uniref:hypothetical protein n=1 Tax=Flavobacterium sp. HSC-61S13 TaxID=2910963 RepID=UPI0020A0AC2C|nr:hypothetical protein [Flavobacterium sp. HSC-61S13]MCP1994354.1 hypothetical protein [Flavobacterium sp. HSC-61S13]